MRNQSATQEEIHLELKYCERCGSLWFRELGTSCVYCDRCLAALDELPAVVERLHVVRLPHQYLPGEDDEERDVHDIDAMRWPTAGGVA